MKKKILWMIAILLLFALVIHIILYKTNWYSEMVDGKNKNGFTSGWDDSYKGSEYDNTDHQSISISNSFRTFDGLDMRYRVSMQINRGSLDIAVFDITEFGNQAYNMSAKELDMVFSETYSESGDYELDFNDLPDNRIYLLTVFENKGSIFSINTL